MRKLPKELENPFDNVMLSMCGNEMMDNLYKNGITPNMITTVGNFFRILSIYFLYHHQKLFFILFYIFGYYFDCLDGHYARQYNLCSKFGDVYDHASDLIFYILLIYYIFQRSSLPNSQYFIPVTILLITFSILLLVHMGCQQIYYKSEDEYLDVCKSLCFNEDWLTVTRHFGCGTYILLITILAAVF